MIGLQRSTLRYEEHRQNDRAVRKRILEIAETRIRYGHQRIHTLLKREGWPDNHKRTWQIYKEKGLNLRRKRPRRRAAAAQRSGRPKTQEINESYLMDFVADQLFNRRRIRALTVIDNFSRECQAMGCVPIFVQKWD